VVEPDALVQAGAARRELGGQRGESVVEELEHTGRGVGPGRVAALGGGLSVQAHHLVDDAVEDQRVALLVAALEVEDPGHQGVVGRLAERREMLGDGVLGHTEAGEEGGEAIAALVRELGPRPGVRGEVDGIRIPLQAGHDVREEGRPPLDGRICPVSTSSGHKRRPVAGSNARSHACRRATRHDTKPYPSFGWGAGLPRTPVSGLRAWAGELEDQRQRRTRARPVLLDHLESAAAEDRSQRQGDDDGVVELTGDWDEVRNHIEGKREVSQQGDDEGPVPARHAGVAEQAPEQDDAVRDESGERSRVCAPPRKREASDEDPVDDECRETEEQQPLRRARHPPGRSDAAPVLRARRMEIIVVEIPAWRIIALGLEPVLVTLRSPVSSRQR